MCPDMLHRNLSKLASKTAIIRVPSPPDIGAAVLGATVTLTTRAKLAKWEAEIRTALT